MMTQEENTIVATAYRGRAAVEYDQQRFVTSRGLAFDTLEWKELQRAVARVPQGALVLEVGCGTSRFAKRLAESGFCVRAVDPSADMIEVSTRKCRGMDNITFAQEEAAALSAKDATFDLVFSIRVTNQTQSKEYAFRMIREMIRVAKPGGLVLVEFANSQRPLKKDNKCTKLSFDQIAQLADELDCCVESRRGILIFSQTILNRIPSLLVPAWCIVEKIAGVFFWRWASRGYCIIKKR